MFLNVLLNDAIRFCLKMPLSGDSYRTEICRARRSIGVCAMGVFTVWHYRTDKRSKILLLFNLLFFINKFYLAILTDHYFASITIVQENFFHSFRDAGNVNQYRAAKGVINNCSFITTKKYLYVTETSSLRKMSLPFLAINIVVLFFLHLHAYSFLSPKI